MEVSGYLLLLVAIAVPCIAFDSCPSAEYERWDTNCYMFRVDSQTFDGAQAYCKSKGGNLATIASASEKNYIKDRMKTVMRWGHSYWIGLRKEGKGAPLVWVDGSDASYRNWAPGEPNDRDGTENCVEMYRGSGQWNDHRCGKSNRGYVCKAPKLYEWRSYNGKEYFLSTSEGSASDSWYSGRAYCQQNGGDLVSILDQAESNQIYEWTRATKYDGTIWVGLNRLEGPNWKWSDGSSIARVNWAPTYPQHDIYGQLCGSIQSKKTPGAYENHHCDNRNKPFICKRRPGARGPVTDPPTQAVQSYCPTGYFSADQGNKCFKMVALNTDNGISFEAALKECRNGPGRLPDLASIHSDDEMAIITSNLQDPSGFGYWIGITRRENGGPWRWTDSTPRDYDNWAPGEPSGSVDHCTEVWTVPGPTGTWNNIDCHSQRGYICETYKDQNSIVVTPNPTTPNTCSPGYTPYWYGCYKLIKNAMNFADAKTMCSQDGGTVVTVHSPAENAAIQSVVLENQSKSVWLGLVDADGSGQYKWVDNWMVFYTNWGANQPKRKAGGGCVILRPDGKWEDVVCTFQYPVVCKTTTATPLTPPPIKDGTCPRGGGLKWEEFHESCYYFEVKKAKTWADAVRDCLLKAGSSTLVSLHSMQENEYVYQKLKEKNVKHNIWTGLIRSRIDKKFYWSDASPVDYENWAPNEPNNAGGDEACVEMYTGAYKKMWNDIKCSNVLNYVCKAPKIPPLPTEKPVPGYCPEGWQALGAQCFYLMPDKLTTWSSAMDACKVASKGRGDLAKLENPGEDDYVFIKMKELTHLPVNKNYWIGLSKKDKDSPYLWSDGTKPKYTNWAPGEPNDKTGTQNCVEVYIENGMWNDHDCNEFVSYVCKMPQFPHGGEGLSSGTKAGIAIGVIVLIALVAIIIVFVLFKMAIIGNPVDKLSSMTGFSNPFYKEQNDSTA